MSRTSLQPTLAKNGEKIRQNLDTELCVHCFKMIRVAPGKQARSALTHHCAEKALALQPAAPPPYN